MSVDMEAEFSLETSSSSSSAAAVGNLLTLKELNRCLRATDAGQEHRRKRGAVTRQSTNSLKNKRWFDDVYNMDDVRRAKRKRTQTEYNQQKRKKPCVRRAHTNVDDLIGDVNADAQKFLQEYEARTQYWECGVCGTDEGLKNLRAIDDAVRIVIGKSDLPLMLSAVKESLNRGNSEIGAYLQCIEQEFDQSGLLKSARYICNSCLKKLKKGRSKMMQESLSSGGGPEVNITCKKKNRHDGLLKESTGFENDRHSLQDEHEELSECEFMDIDNAEHGDDTNSLQAHDEEQEDSEEESDEEEGEMDLSDEICAPRLSTKWSVPRTAYIRGLYPGIIPDELQDLRVVEMSMISIYNPITRLKLNSKGMSYKYFHGHAHAYSIVNDLTSVAARLPWLPSINTFAILKYKNDVCVKELRYRPGVVRKALTWLKEHNHLYADVHIAYPDDWNTLDADAEIEPESMIIDTMEEEEVNQANDEAHKDSDDACNMDEESLDAIGMICCITFNFMFVGQHSPY